MTARRHFGRPGLIARQVLRRDDRGRIVPLHRITCAGCGWWSLLHEKSRANARRGAENQGWVYEDKGWLCPACRPEGRDAANPKE